MRNKEDLLPRHPVYFDYDYFRPTTISYSPPKSAYPHGTKWIIQYIQTEYSDNIFLLNIETGETYILDWTVKDGMRDQAYWQKLTTGPPNAEHK